MTEYFLGLIAFAFVGSVIFSLAPEGASKRQVRFLCGLCSIGCIIFPVFEIISNGGIDLAEISALFTPSDEIDENTVEIYNKSLNSATVKNAEETLKDEIIKGTSAKFDDIDVKISLSKNSDDFYIDGVYVYIYSSGYMIDPEKIEKICVDRLGKKCYIVYK